MWKNFLLQLINRILHNFRLLHIYSKWVSSCDHFSFLDNSLVAIEQLVIALNCYVLISKSPMFCDVPIFWSKQNNLQLKHLFYRQLYGIKQL